MITAIAMPLTFSIADGIALGFISYAGIKVAGGRYAMCIPPLPFSLCCL